MDSLADYDEASPDREAHKRFERGIEYLVLSLYREQPHPQAARNRAVAEMSEASRAHPEWADVMPFVEHEVLLAFDDELGLSDASRTWRFVWPALMFFGIILAHLAVWIGVAVGWIPLPPWVADMVSGR